MSAFPINSASCATAPRLPPAKWYSLLGAACVCVLTSLGGCSTEQFLSLESTSDSLTADGLTVVEIVADVVFRDARLVDGKKVIFRSASPVLFESRAAASPVSVGTYPKGAAELTVRSRGGSARVYVLAPRNHEALKSEPCASSGRLSIEASYTTVNGDVLADTHTFTVGPPPPIAGASNVGGSLSAVVPHFLIVCTRESVGAFVATRPAIEVSCALVLKDQAGNDLPHTPVRLYAEAGELQDVPATSKTQRGLVYRVAEVPAHFPVDVRPVAEEQPYTVFGGEIIPEAVESNPRDGLVTLLAVVRGHEAFHDANDNGTWDPGESFIDEGEPFLDANDNGEYDALIDGEFCCDTNSNGRVDGPNGRWDGDVWLGRMTHILWSGPLDKRAQRSGVLPSNTVIAAQGQQAFSLILVDSHFNPITASASSDRVTFDLNPSSSIAFSPAADFVLGSSHDMQLRQRFPFHIFGDGLGRVFVDLNATGARAQSFTLRDDRSLSSSSLCRDVAWDLTLDIRYTAGQDRSGTDFTGVTESLFASGTLAALPPPCPP